MSLRTAITVMLDEHAPSVASARAELDPLGARRIGLHITLLVPFVPRDAVTAELVAHVRAFFAARSLERFALVRVEEFPGVVAYVAPEPAEGLTDLARAVWDEFPDFPPYGGTVAAGTPVPHATIVAYERVQTTLAEVRDAVEPLLPVQCAPTAVSLLEEYEADRWRTLEWLPFGTAT